MAVARHPRPRVSQQLLERCIQYAKEQGASRVVLTTNDILTPALKVYHKAGFVDLPSNPTPYARVGDGLGTGAGLTPGLILKFNSQRL